MPVNWCEELGTVLANDEVINGKSEKRYVCNFGITLDERIADGFYFAKSFQLFKEYLQNPEVLEGLANDSSSNFIGVYEGTEFIKVCVAFLCAIIIAPMNVRSARNMCRK